MIEKEKAKKAMSLLGCYYDDINSYENYIKFDCMPPNNLEAFKNWQEVSNYIEQLVIDDKQIAYEISKILEEEENNEKI